LDKNNSNVKKFWLLIFFTTFSFFCLANNDTIKTKKLSDRIYYGGNISLMLGSVTLIEVAPIVGYYIRPQLSTGIGFIFQYYREKQFTISKPFTSYIYGGRVFAKYSVIKDLQTYIPIKNQMGIVAYTEYETLNVDWTLNLLEHRPRYWIHNFYIGGGIEQYMGKKSRLTILILYNILETTNSPYSNPQVRIGFTF